jgi:hypothetical protein
MPRAGPRYVYASRGPGSVHLNARQLKQRITSLFRRHLPMHYAMSELSLDLFRKALASDCNGHRRSVRGIVLCSVKACFLMPKTNV